MLKVKLVVYWLHTAEVSIYTLLHYKSHCKTWNLFLFLWFQK